MRKKGEEYGPSIVNSGDPTKVISFFYLDKKVNKESKHRPSELKTNIIYIKIGR